MPMIDALIPENALTPEAEARLLKEMTDILIRAEGYEPDNEVARRVSFLFLHRPAAIFVGGVPSASPRYRGHSFGTRRAIHRCGARDARQGDNRSHCSS